MATGYIQKCWNGCWVSLEDKIPNIFAGRAMLCLRLFLIRVYPHTKFWCGGLHITYIAAILLKAISKTMGSGRIKFAHREILDFILSAETQNFLF